MHAGSRSVGKFLYCVGENWVKHLEATFALKTIAAQALRQVDAHTRRKNWCWPSSALRPKHPSMAQLLARYLKPQQENARKVHVFVFLKLLSICFLGSLATSLFTNSAPQVRGNSRLKTSCFSKETESFDPSLQQRLTGAFECF